MQHTVDDGLGSREVWLDGFLLNRVIECDDVACTAVCGVYPFQIKDGELVTETVSGEVMVVRFLDPEVQ